MSRHFWILEVNGADEQWQWTAKGTERGGLAIRAYESKSAAAPDLHHARQQYGKARLTKYVPESERVTP